MTMIFYCYREHWQLAIVADGAGSAKYSRYGSRLICNTIGQFLVKALTRPIPVHMQNMVHELRGALGLGLCLIEDEAEAQQADIKDYASTVLVVSVVCLIANNKPMCIGRWRWEMVRLPYIGHKRSKYSY
ncbi:MAG: protein phosphatase 2C domain-containing protein [Moraxellaceae bacterium]|nr:protein phosphatase 2C domain-containing protein [Moraxellaceae bacterium]